jgi:uncharacterized protein YjiS (DUF1127 family)
MEMIMSEISNASLPRRLGAETFSSRIGRALRHCWLAYMDWRLQQLAISRLQRMSDRELQDIGLRRSQIDIEVRGGAARHPMHGWRLL